ncbi:MAG TPA: SRPBCC domain-containing protein [Caulobacteraceae bacterium]|nr:SRPBCC domain-containing protein [Caulobacteraceae bacterium]
MSDLGQMLRVPAIRFERLLPGGAAQAWAHLTDCAKLSDWYGDDSTIEPREGGQVRLMGGHIRGVVTQWVPQRKLAHTWNVFAPGEAQSPFPESYLTFELEPEGGGVRLALTHLPVLERFESQNAMGWHTFLDILEASLKARPIEPRAAYMQRNAALYGVDLANLQR